MSFQTICFINDFLSYIYGVIKSMKFLKSMYKHHFSTMFHTLMITNAKLSVDAQKYISVYNPCWPYTCACASRNWYLPWKAHHLSSRHQFVTVPGGTPSARACSYAFNKNSLITILVSEHIQSLNAQIVDEVRQKSIITTAPIFLSTIHKIVSLTHDIIMHGS